MIIPEGTYVLMKSLSELMYLHCNTPKYIYEPIAGKLVRIIKSIENVPFLAPEGYKNSNGVYKIIDLETNNEVDYYFHDWDFHCINLSSLKLPYFHVKKDIDVLEDGLVVEDMKRLFGKKNKISSMRPSSYCNEENVYKYLKHIRIETLEETRRIKWHWYAYHFEEFDNWWNISYEEEAKKKIKNPIWE